MRRLCNPCFSIFFVLLLSSIEAIAQTQVNPPEAINQEKTAVMPAVEAVNAGLIKPIKNKGLGYDHDDPILLNEFAIKHLQQGNTRTAKILLQRAIRLAPHNEIILQNLQLVKKRGGAYLVESVASVPTIAAASNDKLQQVELTPLPSEPPALWPEK